MATASLGVSVHGRPKGSLAAVHPRGHPAGVELPEPRSGVSVGVSVILVLGQQAKRGISTLGGTSSHLSFHVDKSRY